MGQRREDFKSGKRNISLKVLSKHDHSSAVADHVKTTGRNIKWDDFDILAFGKTDYHCKVKETLFFQELQIPFETCLLSRFQTPIVTI